MCSIMYSIYNTLIKKAIIVSYVTVVVVGDGDGGVITAASSPIP